MSLLLILGVVVVGLFVISFITKRRFGVLGLALAAGFILSRNWTDTVTPFIASMGIELVSVPLQMVVAAAIVLLPACLLLLSGPTYSTTSGRILGAAMFATLACAFLVEPLGGYLVPTPEVQSVYQFIYSNHTYIISLGLIVALGDLLITKTHKPPKTSSKH